MMLYGYEPLFCDQWQPPRGDLKPVTKPNARNLCQSQRFCLIYFLIDAFLL